jgi:peptide/nickel transport system substrate-binding protein
VSGQASLQRGGTIQGVAVGDYDSIDPGVTYFSAGAELMTALHRTLYTATLDASAIRPDLATGSPEISADGRTVTVTIRSGVRFSPPVNREVRADDVKYAIERGFTPAVPNGYVNVYFTSLEGARAFQAGKASEITGIQTPDDHTLVFKLTEPVGGFFAGALSMTLTAPVPREYAQRFDHVAKGKQSTYAANQVSTGPYMLERDTQGNAIGYKRDHYVRLVRNPNWDASDPDRPADADRIDIDTHYATSAPATRRVLSGANTFDVGTGPDRRTLRRLLRVHSPQLALVSVPGFDHVSLRTTVKPLDNVDVRRAIAAALDRRALLRLAGGPRLGTIATHFLSPGFPGYAQAGGARSFVDFLAHPAGDVALARRYMRKAGYRSGRYHGPARLAIVTTRDPESRASDRVLGRAFAAVGIPVRFRRLSADASRRECARRAAHVAVCTNGWLADFPDPQTMLQSVFDGRAIIPTNSPNTAFVDDRRINAAIDHAKTAIAPADRAKAWAAVDRLVTTLVPYIPTDWPRFPLVKGKAVEGQLNHLNGEWQLAALGLHP